MNPPETLPKMLPGSVCPQKVKCGRPNCHCAQGKLHGPYFYRFWREGGRLRKEYIPAADVDRVRAACLARRPYRLQLLAAQRQASDLQSLLRSLRQT